jgi:hypothetical protein
VLYDRKKEDQPVLHRYVEPSLKALHEKTPVFQPDWFKEELIPRG